MFSTGGRLYARAIFSSTRQMFLSCLEVLVFTVGLYGASFSAWAASASGVVGDGLGDAPAGLVAAVAKTADHEAAHDSAYAVNARGCATLPGRRLRGCFDEDGQHFTVGDVTVNLRLTAWGRDGRLRPVHLTPQTPAANRIAYRGKGLSEWWRVLPIGYEQGFILDKAPSGKGKVVLELETSAAPTVDRGTLSWGGLRYGKLHVVDADGKVLPATLRSQGTSVRLTFDARHAQYPVTEKWTPDFGQSDKCTSGYAAFRWSADP